MTSAAPDGLTLRRLGQAGFELIADGAHLYIDPFLSDYEGRLIEAQCTPEDLARADAILITHEHADHWDAPALALMPDSDAVVIVPAPLEQVTRDAAPGRTIVPAYDGVPIRAGSAVITPIPVVHGVAVEDGYGFAQNAAGEFPFMGYAVTIGGVTLFHSGDALDYPELAARLRELDVTLGLLPINGRDAEREAIGMVGNMTSAEVVDLAIRANLHTVIPMHYDMFAFNPGSPSEFTDHAATVAPDLTVTTLALGETITLPAS